MFTMILLSSLRTIGGNTTHNLLSSERRFLLIDFRSLIEQQLPDVSNSAWHARKQSCLQSGRDREVVPDTNLTMGGCKELSYM
jgi:hypothetical protein